MHGIIETDDFITDAKAAGMSEAEIDVVKAIIASDPRAGAVMPGSGGGRKLRIKGRGHGKSGGYRVITFYGGDDIPVFLLNVFAKGEKSTLTKAELNAMKAALAGLADDYREGSRK